MAADAWYAALATVSLIGLMDAMYFVAVTYRWIRPDPRWLPNVCSMDEATCARVVDTPYARLLGLPNAVYGLAWYAIAVAAAIVGWVQGDVPLCLALIAVAAATILLSVWLAYVLLVRLKTPCVLCFLGHTVNAAIFGLLVVVCAL